MFGQINLQEAQKLQYFQFAQTSSFVNFMTVNRYSIHSYYQHYFPCISLVLSKVAQIQNIQISKRAKHPQTKMIKILLLTTLIAGLATSTEVHPIQAGTFKITMADFGAEGETMYKDIQIATSGGVFQSNQGIQVICSISAMDMDERVAIQFQCRLAKRPSGEYYIEVELERKNSFHYSELDLSIDFLISQEIRTIDLNMTSWQEHIENRSVSEEEKVLANKDAHNELLTFPTGWSSFNLTSSIMYGYVSNYDMYVVHYMNRSDAFEQGFRREIDFLLFKMVLRPKYPFGHRSCPSLLKYHLEDDFYYECNKNQPVDGYFYGIAGYSGRRFRGSFYMARTGFSFHVKSSQPGSEYDIMAFPFRISDKFTFIDNRVHDYDYFEERHYIKYAIIVVVLVIAVAVIFTIMKRRKVIYFDLQEEGSSTHVRNNRKNNGAENEKNSDEEMKEQEFKDSSCNDTDGPQIIGGKEGY